MSTASYRLKQSYSASELAMVQMFKKTINSTISELFGKLTTELESEAYKK
jgi:hypothetical protein